MQDNDNKKSNRWSPLIYDSLRDPLLVVESNGKIIFANVAARTSLDLGKRETLLEVVSLEKSFAFNGEGILELVRHGGPTTDYRFRDPEGNESDVVADILELVDSADGDGVKLVHIRDFSRFKSTERWKDEMIALVAHEIKNPLAAMKNSFNIIMTQEKGRERPENNRYLAASMRSIDRLTRLLDALLDISRIQSGAFELDRKWVGGREFIRDVADSFKTLFNVTQFNLEIDVSESIDRIFVDALKLEQVLINLLSNAVKYTRSSGRIALSLRSAGMEALSENLRILPWHEIIEPRFIRVAVEDTGLGMSEDTLAHLFTRHYGTASEGGSRGSHLGLSISKALIEMQDGTLTVESELGIGTEVTICLPEDERTVHLMSRLNSIGRCLDKALNGRKTPTLYVLRKENSADWVEVGKAWKRVPVFNPSRSEEKSESLLFWGLTPEFAVLMWVYGDDPPAMEQIFGTSVNDGEKWGHHLDGYWIGKASAPAEGVLIEQLIRLGIQRTKYPSPIWSRP